jgi:hypothetical protein
MGLLFDNKFPTKQFMRQVLSISESDWVNNQPARSLASLGNSNPLINAWKKLDIDEEIRIHDAPKEFVQFAKVWKMNGYETTSVNKSINGVIYGNITPPTKKIINVFSSHILREKADIVFGEDLDWTQERMRAIKSLAMVFNKPNKKAEKEMYIRNEGLKIPKWAIQ